MKKLIALTAVLLLATTILTGCPPGQVRKAITHGHH